MTIRSFRDTAFGIEASTRDPKHVVFLVHGFNFSGNISIDHPKTYWGRVGGLFLDEPVLENTDIVFFSYPSNPSLIPKKTSLLGGKVGCAYLDEIISLLQSAIYSYLSSSKMESYSIIGHSLGTHIALRAAAETLRNKKCMQLSSLNLIAAPNKPHWIARTHKFISRGKNPHTAFLGDELELYRNLNNGVAEIRKSAKNMQKDIPIRHIHSVGDPFVKYKPEQVYDDTITIKRSHTWFDEVISPLDYEYKTLISWITGANQ
ncbi:hypothetical protein KFE96_07925 [Kordiimonas sp. SCSIO 12603]|uniref:hypothetical protein n=1 Tax=Kordiimonas sp. SCSIO 12603 TaxID=2829596 RepID=UPI0021047A04|nr:hypothetical protein [Kordiimonas sp. SCSIO 12603]UTW60229.1 hypothetical protein KFE96_07925 [Kordiimonas sp. SCSIO 12603]